MRRRLWTAGIIPSFYVVLENSGQQFSTKNPLCTPRSQRDLRALPRVEEQRDDHPGKPEK